MTRARHTAREYDQIYLLFYQVKVVKLGGLYKDSRTFQSEKEPPMVDRATKSEYQEPQDVKDLAPLFWEGLHLFIYLKTPRAGQFSTEKAESRVTKRSERVHIGYREAQHDFKKEFVLTNCHNGALKWLPKKLTRGFDGQIRI